MSLVDEGIREINEAGITSERGTYEEFDVIILATVREKPPLHDHKLTIDRVSKSQSFYRR
jgi:hypothetical protein